MSKTFYFAKGGECIFPTIEKCVRAESVGDEKIEIFEAAAKSIGKYRMGVVEAGKKKGKKNGRKN